MMYSVRNTPLKPLAKHSTKKTANGSLLVYGNKL
jgi:hypothetical protein